MFAQGQPAILTPRISRAGLPVAALSQLFTSAAHESGAMPEPIPHTAQGPEDVGGLPIPIPHEARGPHDIGAMPEPIPHTAQGLENVGNLPIPIPHEARRATRYRRHA